jgi:hypothetical protein
MKNIKHDMVPGYIHDTKNNGKLEIIEYIDSYKKVSVRFIGYEHIVTASADRIRRGVVKNVLLPSVFGKGYVGLGSYSATKHKKAYQIWVNMLQRCYLGICHDKQPTYLECTVCEEWHNFQNFADWFYKLSNFTTGYQLDKDIKVKGNKHYSPTTCLFVPQPLNLLIRTHENIKEKGCPVGVRFNKRDKYFNASIYYEGSQKNLGCFKTLEEATEAYQKARGARIRELVDNNVYPEITPYLLQHI